MNMDERILAKIEEELRINCPSPEEDLVKLSLVAVHLPDSMTAARVRRFVVDIDDLISQVRWHLGQALLLMDQYGELLKEDNNEESLERLIRQVGAPTSVLLLLRGYIHQADRVLYGKADEPRRGGTAAGWLFHMMIDSAIYRTIAVLDRIAHILWYAAELPRQNQGGREIYVYFRSKRMQAVDASIQSPESGEIVKIASSPLFEFITQYRDGLTHEAKAYSSIAGTIPADVWKGSDGTSINDPIEKWNVELLFALGRAAYFQVLEALKNTVVICDSKLESAIRQLDGLTQQ